MHDMIPLSVPNISSQEIDAVSSAMSSGWVSTGGPEIGAFEKAMATFTGSPHAVALNSGSAALHVGLLALGVGPGDLVLVSNLTYTATLNAISYVGATPILVDCDAQSMQMDSSLVESYLKNETRFENGKCIEISSGQTVKLILAVHALGYPAPVEGLLSLARAQGVMLMEDAAAGVGSFSRGKHLGTFGIAGVLSFNGNKILTTGGGGMLLTSDPEIAERARHLALQAKSFPTEYIHDRIGYNYGMTNMAAAFGRAQLSRLDGFLNRKESVHQFYQGVFSSTDFKLFSIPMAAGDRFNHWLEVVFHPDAPHWVDELEKEHGIQARRLWVPMNRLPMHVNRRYLSHHDHAQGYYDRGLCIPASSSISDADLSRVAEVLLRLSKS
jgi:perosamine synthetase